MPKKIKYSDTEDIDDDDDKLSNDDKENEDENEDENNDVDDEDIDDDADTVSDEFEKSVIDNEEDDEDNEEDFNDLVINDLSSDQTYLNKEYIIGDKRISRNILSKYEMVRILGERSKQLSVGAQPLINNYNGLSYYKIAEEELKLDMIPFKIVRPTPNGRKELWLLNELSKEHLMYLLESD